MAVVTALVLERPMCLGCVATRAGVSPLEIDALVERVSTVLKLYRDVARCRTCSAITRVVSVERPTDGARRTS